MIESFLASWDLFHNTYLAGWLIGLLLSLVGVTVVARDQIFIGAAVSQASTLGIALAFWIGGWATVEPLPWIHSDEFMSIMAVAFSVVAALLTTRLGRIGEESHEAITGWVFLLSASLSILIVAHSPHGLEEILRLLSSSIIGAAGIDVWIFSLLAAATVLMSITHCRPLLLFVFDPETAAALGMRTWRWEILTSAWLGLAVGLSMRTSGMLYTFGCLILPPLAAKNLCREARLIFLLSPMIAVGGGMISFMTANHYDYPPGQMTVALLSFLAATTWLIRRLRH